MLQDFAKRPASVLAFVLLTALLGAGLCAPVYAQAPQPEIPETWPKWLQKAMKKDSRKKRTQALNLGDGQIVTRMLGKIAGEPQPFDGGWSVDSDIGAGMVVNCWVFTDPRNLANQLERTHRALIKNIARALDDRPIKEQLPYFVDIGVRDGVPYAGSDWLFTVGDDTDLRVDLSKVRVAKKEGATFACSHPELGYRKAFARLFDTLVDEATINLPGEAPYYREIVQISLGQRKAGLATLEFTLDADGDTRARAETTMLMQIDARSLIASDTVKVEYSTPDGYVINAYDSNVENGELKSDLALNFNDTDGWLVDGMFGGKQISSPVTAEREILSALGQMRLFARVIEGQQTTPVEFGLWIAEADPATIQTGTIAVGERGANRHPAAVALGPIKMDAALDDAGSVLAATIALGANTMRLERVHVEGSIPTQYDD